MKIVSIKVTNALKDAGYKFPPLQSWWACSKDNAIYDEESDEWRSFPTYMEVWLWLWREKHIAVEADYSLANDDWFDGGICGKTFHDPEDAIVAGIDYLVENNLIK